MHSVLWLDLAVFKGLFLLVGFDHLFAVGTIIWEKLFVAV